MGDIRLFLRGDVMSDRGIDQVLAHPGAAAHEPCVDSVPAYVTLAERAHGSIARGMAHEHARFGTGVEPVTGGRLALRWCGPGPHVSSPGYRGRRCARHARR